jgi:general stress protein YciG
MTDKPKPRGFAAMSPEQRKLIQSLGGKASPGNFKNDLKRAKAGGRKSRRTYEPKLSQ